MVVPRPVTFGVVLTVIVGLGLLVWQMARSRNHFPGRSLQVPWGRSTSQTLQRGGAVSRRDQDQPEEERLTTARMEMVQKQLAARDIGDKRVLEALRQVPRHLFVPVNSRSRAYSDGPLPIGYEQTISQPYIVALMTQLAQPTPSSTVLDVGTGSGYQAAVLSLLCQEVYSIEIVETLATTARQLLHELHYRNVTVRHGDGYQGWPEKGPFDAVIVAAAPDHVPQPLIDQLKPHGRLVIPVGKHYQNLLVIEKQTDGTTRQLHGIPVAFVPMTGQAQQRDNPRR